VIRAGRRIRGGAGGEQMPQRAHTALHIIPGVGKVYNANRVQSRNPLLGAALLLEGVSKILTDHAVEALRNSPLSQKN